MGGWSVIPNFYWGHPIEEGLVFGLGFSATSGTKTSHPRGWIGRYDGILTDIAVVDVNPAISYRLGDDLSIGAGLVFEYAFMKMDSAMDLSALGRRDGKTKIEGDSTSVGFNLGVTYEPLEGTTVGLGYRSRMRHKMDVNVRSHGTRGLEVLGTRSDGTSVLHFPSAATIGIMQKLTERWRAGLDIAYCFQSYMKDIRVKFDDKYMGRPKDSEMKIRMGWKNSWRISLGTEYDLTERLTLRGGFTWDQSPVTNRYRNVQLPDADRYWLSVGLGCRITEKWTLDLAWTHIFFPNVSLNQAGGGNDKTAMLRGKASGNSNTVSVALSCRF
jgi:long-chain fatty acid transport protein